MKKNNNRNAAKNKNDKTRGGVRARRGSGASDAKAVVVAKEDDPKNPRPWLVKHYFKKGDPRIFKGGAPKPFTHVHKLAQSIGDEEVEITIGDGGHKQSLVMTRTELILLDWAMSMNPTKQELFVAYAYGRVPNVNYNANMTLLLRKYADKLTDAELARVKAGESVVDILLAKLPDVADEMNSDSVDVDSEDA